MLGARLSDRERAPSRRNDNTIVRMSSTLDDDAIAAG